MSNLEIIIEFINPIEKSLNLIFIGDAHLPEFKTNTIKYISNIRQNLSPPFKRKPKTLEFNTKQTFSGEHQQYLYPSSIIFLDPIIAKQTIQTLIHDPDLDPLEAMLIDKFIINPSPPAFKYILDIAFVSPQNIQNLIQFLDTQLYPPNYLAINDFLALWFDYSPDDL